VETLICDNWHRICAPRDRRPIYDWAPDNIKTLPASMAIRNPRRLKDSRQFLPIFDSLHDDAVRRTVYNKPTRGGGTMISDVWHVSTRSRDPGPALIVMQSDDEARKHAETRIMPMMLDCDAVKPFLPSDPNRIRTQAILFADNLPFYIHGPGINKLQSKGLRYITLDEPWLYAPGTINEAEQRLGDFAEKSLDKMYLCSQGGVEKDDLDNYWMSGDQALWSVECIDCHKYFVPLWTHPLPSGQRAGMRWEEHKDERRFWKIEECLNSVRYECPHCGYHHQDRSIVKSAWNDSGKYVSTNPSAPRSTRSFRSNAIIYFPWQILVKEYLTAVNARKMGIIEPLIAFFQKRMAEPKSEATLMEGTLSFRSETITLESVKEDEELRAASFDRQGEDLYWGLVGSWNRRGEFRRLWYGKLFGRGALKEKADEFQCTTVAVDSGHEARGDMGVYAMCAKFHCEEQHWIALKGTDDDFFYHVVGKGQRIRRTYSEMAMGDPERGAGGQGEHPAIFIRFSAAQHSHRVAGLIRTGFWIEPDDKETPTGREYRRQMSAEYLAPQRNKFTGLTVLRWVCPSGNNHARDCAKMQTCLATIAGILPDTEVEIAEKTK
jgi:hypothetical protein